VRGAGASRRGIRLAADLEQDLARPLGWGASPPSCSRSAQPPWGASRGALFHPEEREEKLLLPLQGELHRLEGKRGKKRERKRKKTSRPALLLQGEGEAFSVSLRRLEGKRRREKKRTSRLPLPLFRRTSDLLVDLGGIASFRMRE